MTAPHNPDWDTAFRNSPHRLRFELGGEVFSNVAQPVPRFLQALDRSRSISRAVFRTSRKVFAVVGFAADPKLDFYAPVDDASDALRLMGFHDHALAEWRGAVNEADADEDRVEFLWKSFDLSQALTSREILLWCNLTYEMAIEPKLPMISYLVDFESGILLHVYDDRGMDVIATNASTLLPIYQEFDSWLLDYDRARMSKIFS